MNNGREYEKCSEHDVRAHQHARRANMHSSLAKVARGWAGQMFVLTGSVILGTWPLRYEALGGRGVAARLASEELQAWAVSETNLLGGVALLLVTAHVGSQTLIVVVSALLIVVAMSDHDGSLRL